MYFSRLARRFKKLFEGKKKNPISLSSDDNLDENLKALKIGEDPSPIELSSDKIRINATEATFGTGEGKVTINGATLNLGPNVTNFTINSQNLLLNIASGGNFIIKDDSELACFIGKALFILYSEDDPGDQFKILVAANGQTLIQTIDDDGVAAHLTLQPDGDLILDPASQKVIINALDGLYLDGGGDNYVIQAAPDLVRWHIGGDLMFSMYEGGTAGNMFGFGTTTAGFTQFEPTYDATDTDVNFRTNGNKAFCTFGSGNIADMNLYFPDQSCNCTLLLKQDGTGSRLVTTWKTWDMAAGNESTVVWPAATAPTLTTGANKIDIISFYWDNDNHKAYGVATLNF